ncbi:MAG: helix-turn-helix transcriptional regulator [Chitinophagaceae bacterium]|nr:helix-turn-helix transcriptional regulator [Chitinophagaceae bacterium]
MAIELYSGGRGPLRMMSGLPGHYDGATLPGSDARHYRGDIGQIVLQEISHLQNVIRYAVFRIADQVKLKFIRRESGLQTTAILKDHCRTTFDGAGRFKINEGYFSTIFSNPWSGTLQCGHDAELIAFDTTWDAAMLHEFIPAESKWWDKFKNGVPAFPLLIGNPYRKITPSLNRLIDQLKYSSYDPSLRKSSLDHLVKDYLAEILREIDNPDWLKDEIPRDELDRIEAVKQLIAADPLKHVHSAELARMVYMNEFKFKTMFMKVTGMGTFDYMMYQRCCAVRDKILHSDLPVKSFVQEAGYSDLANFVTGFKRYMGCTPADIRK